MTSERRRAARSRRPTGGSAAPVVALVSVLAIVLATVTVVAQQPSPSYKSSPFLRIDPDKIVVADGKGFKPCGECHTPEWDVWKETKHATGFETMHKSESAQDILTNMNLSVTKRQEAVCMRCHYTVGPERKAVAGVSCESCHGAARDWVAVHNTWSDGAKERAQETPAGREQRIATSRAAGMLRPSTDLYGVAANCFECHTVPIEDLVNRGQHKAGTSGFELVKRVNSIRHNFLAAGKTGGTNRPMPAERARVMFVVGRMLAYEYSLRGLAAATTAGVYSRSMDRRVKDASRQLDELSSTAHIASVTEVLKIGAKARLVPNNRAELESAADQIRVIGERFVATTTGTTLAMLDPVIAGEPLSSQGTVAARETSTPAQATATPPAAATAAAATPPNAASSVTAAPTRGSNASSAAAAPAAPTPSRPSPAAPAGSAEAPAARPELPGVIRSRPTWHTADGRRGMAEAGECAGCHGDAEAALADGPHQRAAQRLKGESAKARQIAELYGIGAAAMARPDKLCMSCHATVDEANKTVQDEGVTCEACHGAGASYLDPHKKGGNPQLGMRALKQASARAQVCSDCHRITDERLLAAGHPDGAKKDIVAASNKIKHWPGTKPERARQKRGQSYTEVSDESLRAAYAAIASARPIPRVTVVASRGPAPRAATTTARAERPVEMAVEPVSTAPPPRGATETTAPTAPTPTTAPAAGGRATQTPLARAAQTASVRAAQTPSARAAQTSIPPNVPSALPRRVASGNVSLELEPIPPTERLTTEELMLLMKQRIARVNAAIRRVSPQP